MLNTKASNITVDYEIKEKIKKVESLKIAIAEQKSANDIKFIEYSTLQDLISEETKVLNEGTKFVTHNRELIRNNRKFHCDNVRNFCRDYGVSRCVSIIEDFCKKSLHKSGNEEVFIVNEVKAVQLAISENETLKKLLEDTLSEINNCETKIKELCDKNEKLEEEYNEGSEILRLKAAIALSRQQKRELEMEYSKLENSCEVKDIMDTEKKQIEEEPKPNKLQIAVKKSEIAQDVKKRISHNTSNSFKRVSDISIDDIIDVPKIMSNLNTPDHVLPKSSTARKYKPQHFKIMDNNPQPEFQQQDDDKRETILSKLNLRTTYRNLHKYCYRKPK